MAKKNENTGNTSPVEAPIKKPLSKIIHNRGTSPVVIGYTKQGPDVIQVNRKRKLETAVADKLLARYKELIEVKEK